MPENKKCAIISLIGAPNAGKSTLLNQMVGEKVSIVTPKVQTTRNCMRGIAIYDNTQLIFIDTPGIFRATKKLDRRMVQEAWGGVEDSDVTLFLVDAKKGIDTKIQDIIKHLQGGKSKVALVINKVDAVAKAKLLDMAGALNAMYDFTQTYMISALKGDGVKDLVQYLADEAGVGPWLYPEDQVSDLPMRLFAAELTREALFFRLQQELPYSLMVETESWEEDESGKNGVKIHQVIYVTRESHKKILLGKKGEGIKDIGSRTRKQLQEMLKKKVHLFIFVKVRPEWQDRRETY